MSRAFFRQVININIWHFLWITVLLAEVLASVVTTVLSYLWWQQFSVDVFLIGSITTLIVSLVVATIVIYCIQEINNEHVAELQDSARLLQDALQKSEMETAKTNAIITAIGDGISIQDRDFKVVYQNQVHIDLIGEQTGEYCYRAYANSEEVCPGCPIAQSFIDGKVHLLEKSFVEGDKTRHIEISASSLTDKAGEIVAGIEVVRDITQRRRMEDELNKAHRLESIGILAGGIAHDFNNLLTAIVGNISLIRYLLPSNEKINNMLLKVEEASERGRDLTMQLLTFSKGGTPVKEMASVSEIIEDSISFILSGSNIDYDFVVTDKLWPAEVDKGQLSQVIQNLTINSMHAMPEGGKIIVQAKNKTIENSDNIPLIDGNYVLIDFIDEGYGIPKDCLSKVFDPYFSTKEKGSGLGLAAAYSIVNKHNGLLAVESEQGIGTSFYIYLPALLGRSYTKKEKSTGVLRGNGKILVMDDEAIVLDSVCEMLEHLGYQVEVATEGLEAVSLYQKSIDIEQPFDGAILDLTIPGKMGGKDTVKELLAIDPDAKVIVSSGYANDPIMAEYEKYGFKDIAAKPYNLEKLSRVMASLLSLKCQK